jgi:hypothetical protein
MTWSCEGTAEQASKVVRSSWPLHASTEPTERILTTVKNAIRRTHTVDDERTPAEWFTVRPKWAAKSSLTTERELHVANLKEVAP